MAVKPESARIGPPEHSSLKLSFNVPTMTISRVTILRPFFPI